MKTREEIESEIKILLQKKSDFLTGKLGYLQSEITKLESRIAALDWVLQQTVEEPLTQIELKQLRKIMAEKLAADRGLNFKPTGGS